MATIDKIPGPGSFTRWQLSDEHAQVDVIPERGGLVTRFGDVLFLDEATLLDPAKNVRGGIPLLFPFAGKAPGGSPLGQHGFARKLPWKATSAVADEDTARLECCLESSAETRAGWPYEFRCDFAVSLFDGRLMLEWAFHNPASTPMPLHFGIHPYFHVPDKTRARVDVGLTRAFDNRLGRERDVERIDFSGEEIDLHFAPFERGGVSLERGDGRRVRLAWTEHFNTLVLWTLPAQPFVCVEPWTARGGQPARHHVAAGATERLAVECWLE